nr:MAG TPA: hypothetical protein [Caudoviricetes sp.]
MTRSTTPASHIKIAPDLGFCGSGVPPDNLRYPRPGAVAPPGIPVFFYTRLTWENGGGDINHSGCTLGFSGFRLA